MLKEVRNNILNVLSKAKYAIKQHDPLTLHMLSDQTIDDASIYQDEYNLDIAILMFGMAKILSRCTEKECPFSDAFIPHLEKAYMLLVKEDFKGYHDQIHETLQLVQKTDSSLSLYAKKVLSDARLKKSARLYEHGLSIAQSASTAGVSQWELYNYVGATKVNEGNDSVTNMKKRLAYVRKLHGGTLVFDAGPIITLSLNGLLWVLPELKKMFNTTFLIPAAVKNELVNKPLATKKYKLEALQIIPYLQDGTFEVIDEIKTHVSTKKLMEEINGIYSARNHKIQIVHPGEIDAISLCLLNGTTTLIVDERNTRYLVESPAKLHKRLDHKLRTHVQVDKGKLKTIRSQFKHLHTIRSVELITVAFEHGIFDKYLTSEVKQPKKQLLEGLLWGAKLKGCAIREDEIATILRDHKQ